MVTLILDSVYVESRIITMKVGGIMKSQTTKPKQIGFRGRTVHAQDPGTGSMSDCWLLSVPPGSITFEKLFENP